MLSRWVRQRATCLQLLRVLKLTRVQALQRGPSGGELQSVHVNLHRSRGGLFSSSLVVYVFLVFFFVAVTMMIVVVPFLWDEGQRRYHGASGVEATDDAADAAIQRCRRQ